MIQYLCDRCKASLSGPVDSHLLTLIRSNIAKAGVGVSLPSKVRIEDKEPGFKMEVAHFCAGCLEDLAVWRATPKPVA